MTESDQGLVLLVEDDPDVADVVRLVLGDAGFKVVHAANGTAGLAAYEENRPDCIVLDVVMPGLDGWAVLNAIRDTDANTPVIMLTALGGADQRVAGLRQGADDYLPKPFAVDELVIRVQKQVDGSKRLRRLESAKDDAVREVVKRYSTTIPHELNQPLSVIVGYGELIEQTELTLAETREMAIQMALAGHELAKLVRKFARLQDYRTRQFGGAEMIDLESESPSIQSPGHYSG